MPNHTPLIILGSARKRGATHQLTDRLFGDMPHATLDLLDYTIYPYDYAHHYPADDAFPEIIDTVLQHDQLVFATPVYWYALSGRMKTFFDRLTDLVTVAKTRGRQLKGKKTYLIATGTDPQLPEGFEVPFRRTSDYLDMHFLAACYCPSDQVANPPNCAAFLERIYGNSV